MKTSKQSKHITHDIRVPAANSRASVGLLSWLQKNPELLALLQPKSPTHNEEADYGAAA